MSTEIQAYSLGNLESIQRLSVDLQNFISANKLTTNIQGKQYVNVEGWQAAGGLLGIVPIVRETVNHSNDNECKYEATVDLIRVADGSTVGKGIAVCSNKESKKRTFDEYAVLSMAQTRAIGKAYRNLLAWVMRMSGFEATPAEEMDFASKEEQAAEVKAAIGKLANAHSLEDLKDLKAMLPPFVLANADFIVEAKKRQEALRPAHIAAN